MYMVGLAPAQEAVEKAEDAKAKAAGKAKSKLEMREGFEVEEVVTPGAQEGDDDDDDDVIIEEIEDQPTPKPTETKLKKV